MAKIICSKSGIEFKCEYMPMSFAAPTYDHPMFHVPQRKLLSMAGKWAAGEFKPIESYLLYLALLNSTDLVVWRSHAVYIEHKTDAIVASNMQQLVSIIGKINIIHHPNFTLPTFVVSHETSKLENSKFWIEVWINNYHEWYDNYLSKQQKDELRDKLDRREEVLQRLIKSSTPPDKYAKLLAAWASVAGDFPSFIIDHPITGQKAPLNLYWKQLIAAAADDDRFWRFPRHDIDELIEHCEQNIEQGNIYAFTLMKYLRHALKKYDDYLGFGDWNIAGKPTTFTVIPPDTKPIEVMDINKRALEETAPEVEPKKSQYPTTLSWLKAWTKWKMVQADGIKSKSGASTGTKTRVEVNK